MPANGGTTVRLIRPMVELVKRGWLLSLVLTIGGCARSVHSLDGARDAFAAGDLATARVSLQELAGQRTRISDSAALDLAVVELADGDVTAAEQHLRQLRDRFDALPVVSPIHEAASVVADDTVRRYQPAGYEQVMIRAMLAVCSLASDGSDAESYALQATVKQQELARAAEQRGVLEAADVYQPIALAPYLQGVLREASHHDYDDAERAYRLVSTVRPQFSAAEQDIARASEGTHSAPGHGVLYILACVGRGPVLAETTAPTTSTALSIASAVLNAETNRSDSKQEGPALPNIASVKIPTVVLPPSQVASLVATVNGQSVGATEVLTDVGTLACRQAEAELPWTLARAVVRRVTKEATVAKVGDSLGLEGTAGSLFHFAAASAWSGSEHADTRCWGLLPREIQVLRVELPVGIHRVNLVPIGPQGIALAAGKQRDVAIIDGRNHYLVTIAPDRAMYIVARQD